MQGDGYPQAFAAVCHDVREHGWKRVILLGEDLREGPYSLKACLAQSRVMVLSPGAGDKAWLHDVAAKGSADDAAVARFAALMSGGVEHGVQAILATDAFLADMVRAVDLGIPTIAVGETHT